MFLKSISLKNFRNYSNQKFEFKNLITILLGDNAQGKSNFLEAIYFLANAKSPKAFEEIELIKSGEKFLIVEGTLDDETNLQVSLELRNGNSSIIKKIKLNKIPKRFVDYTGNLATILFSPEDINLINGSPTLRRGHLDQIISSVDKNYKKNISSYENILTRKNKILKKIREGIGKLDELKFWVDNQILLASLILSTRESFFDFINFVDKKFGNFKLEYKPSELTLKRLNEYRQKEIDSAMSLIGPQRDDFLFLLDGKDLSKFGSRGEQRTATLDLKFSELKFVEKKLDKRPILLLDDIFSELDEIHKQHVIDLSLMQQTVIAAVELDNSLKKKFQDAKFIYVENGKLSGKVEK